MPETIEISAEVLAEWEREEAEYDAHRESIQAARKSDLVPKSWVPVTLSPKQRSFLLSEARFNVVPAGRRSFKTKGAKRRLVTKAIEYCGPHDDAWFVACAPTNSQAKRIFWRDLKSMVPKELLREPVREGEMLIPLYNGADIQVMGMDVPERIEGRGTLMHILMDEYGNMKPHSWAAHVRPALTDGLGSADFTGVPEGRNHYYDLWRDCQADKSGDWAGFTWTTAEILPLYLGKEQAEKEIAAAKRDMDELTFRQEFEADFVSFEGRAYYTFDAAVNAAHPLPYIPTDPLHLMFDFNVAPGVAAIGQEHHVDLDGRLHEGALCRTCIIGEVHIKRNSNTPAVCRKILETYGGHKGQVILFGDATGGADGSAKVAGSDWDLIEKVLRPVYGDRLHSKVPRSNPYERQRVNAVNSRCKSTDGTVWLLVDPKCRYIIKDFEGTPLLEGGSGEIDKKENPELSHLTDAIGYKEHKLHPVRDAYAEVEQN